VGLQIVFYGRAIFLSRKSGMLSSVFKGFRAMDVPCHPPPVVNFMMSMHKNFHCSASIAFNAHILRIEAAAAKCLPAPFSTAK
jgi:hypothetical protein